MQQWLSEVTKLPFVKAARMVPVKGDLGIDGELVIRTAGGDHRLLVEEKRTYLTIATAEQAARQMRETAPKDAWLLAAPYVGPEVGRHLVEAQVNYADDVGNCHLALGPGYVAHIEGRRPTTRLARDRGVRAQGYLVMFALQAHPELVNAPVRSVAAAAGVGKTTVAQMFAKLEAEGIVGQRGKQRRILDEKRMMNRWLLAYENPVRPFLLVGRYRAPEREPARVEQRIEKALPGAVAWAWGGGAAAMRLTKFFRGAETVLHIADPPADIDRRLGILPARGGDINVLAAPGTAMLEGAAPRTAHPLLVYTELMTCGDPRALEAAGILANRYLKATT